MFEELEQLLSQIVDQLKRVNDKLDEQNKLLEKIHNMQGKTV